MELGELPMILFTVLSQMCVGAFVVLGCVQLLGSRKYSAKAIDRLADPAVFALGPAMILGLLASMLHMHDVLHAPNVIRNVATSWLSREIIFGVGFAGLGFVFFLVQVFKWFSPRARQLLAGLTAFFGVGLVVCQSQIYQSLVTVPAWNSWFTALQFFVTTVLLGSLLVAMTFVLVIGRRRARMAQMSAAELAALDTSPTEGSALEAVTLASVWGLVKKFQFITLIKSLIGPFKEFFADRRIADSQTRAQVDELMKLSVRGTLVLAIVAAITVMAATPVYLNGLTAKGDHGLASAAHFASGLAVARYVLLGLGALVGGVIGFFVAGHGIKKLRLLAVVTITSLLVTLAAEFLGRTIFYEMMSRVGI